MSNTCALFIRIITLLLLIYTLTLSILTLTSCHFLSALTPSNEAHGVGLTSFELESGQCLSHSTYIIRNYNGMEVLAKAGGIAAPCFAGLAILLLLLECCRGTNKWGGKFLPLSSLLISTVSQGLTFCLFRSELFCATSDVIDKCVMEEAAYRSVQATILYFVALILCLCGGTPEPIMVKDRVRLGMSAVGVGQEDSMRYDQEEEGRKSNNSSNSSSTKKKKSGEYTREDYERRRKEKKVSGRGVSGRSKKQIYESIGDGSGRKSSSSRTRSSSRNGRSVRKSSTSSRALVVRERSEERKYSNYNGSPGGDGRRGGGGGEDSRHHHHRDYYYEDEEEHYRHRNDDDYTDYSGRGGGGWDNDDGSRYESDRSGYLGTVYDDSRYSREYSRENSRESSRHDSYRSGSGRSPRDKYDDDNDGGGGGGRAGYNDDYTEGEDTFGEPYDDGKYDRRGGEDEYNDGYYSKHDSTSRYAERKSGRYDASYNDGYDESTYNDDTYNDGQNGGGDYHDGRRRDDEYYDGPPLT